MSFTRASFTRASFTHALFTRALSTLVVVAVLAAGCGSTKKVDPAADLALAKASVLTAADVSGYKASPHTASDDIPAAVKKSFAACMKTSQTIFDDSPDAQRADSPDFAKGEAEISGETTIYAKRGDVDDRWKQISKPAAAPCLAQLFEDGAKSGADASQPVTFGATSATQFSPGVGSRSVGYAVKLTLTVSGETAVFYAEVVFAQRDRAAIDVEFVNVGSALDRKLETSLVQKIYDRIGAKAS
jgi:hypothetical protein